MMTVAERSGSVSSKDPLVAFLYLLMRDHLPTGAVGDIVKTVESGTDHVFSNGWLASYATDVADRIRANPDAFEVYAPTARVLRKVFNILEERRSAYSDDGYVEAARVLTYVIGQIKDSLQTPVVKEH